MKKLDFSVLRDSSLIFQTANKDIFDNEQAAIQEEPNLKTWLKLPVPGQIDLENEGFPIKKTKRGFAPLIQKQLVQPHLLIQ